MGFTVVDHKAHTLADLQKVADLYGHRCGLSAYFDAVTGFKILPCLLCKVLFRLQLKLYILGRSISNAELQFSSGFVDCDNLLTPFSILAIMELIDWKGVIKLVSYYETWILHEVLSLTFEACVVFFLTEFIQY